MASVNKVFLLGNVGKDPEIRYLASGAAVTNISLATTSRRKDKSSGETIEETQWHRIVFYERLAEIVGEYVKKGSPIFIEGRLKYGEYEDKDGIRRYTTDIVATELQLLGSKPDGQQGRQDQQRPPSPAPAPRGNNYAAQSGGRAAPRQGSGFDDMDDDIPF